MYNWKNLVQLQFFLPTIVLESWNLYLNIIKGREITYQPAKTRDDLSEVDRAGWGEAERIFHLLWTVASLQARHVISSIPIN
jgi:hypothetical protein